MICVTTGGIIFGFIFQFNSKNEPILSLNENKFNEGIKYQKHKTTTRENGPRKQQRQD